MKPVILSLTHVDRGVDVARNRNSFKQAMT